MPAKAVVVSGTDTGVGKTVFAAMLTLVLDGVYWKPVQSGPEGSGTAPSSPVRGKTDAQRARSMSGLPEERFLREAYLFKASLSPHHAAELEGLAIDSTRLKLPDTARPLIVEGAGGLMVPLTRSFLQIELFRRWGAPVILCARTTLGTINHTLLSVEALRRRHVSLLGIAFIGDPMEESERAILAFSGVRGLGRLPRLDRLGPGQLSRAFEENFRREDFAAALRLTPA